MRRIWIPAFRGRALLSIERTDIIRRLDKLKGEKSAWTGKISNFPVRHARSVISNFFNWCAAGERFGLKNSPAVRLSDKVLKLNPNELRRSRVLSNEELRAVWHGLDDLLPVYRDIVRLLMLIA
jgi:hypothetical protein